MIAKTKPVKPGFLTTHKLGFTGLKIGGLPGFSGTRVSFPTWDTVPSLHQANINDEMWLRCSVCRGGGERLKISKIGKLIHRRQFLLRYTKKVR